MKKLLRVTRKIYFAWQEARSTFIKFSASNWIGG